MFGGWCDRCRLCAFRLKLPSRRRVRWLWQRAADGQVRHLRGILDNEDPLGVDTRSMLLRASSLSWLGADRRSWARCLACDAPGRAGHPQPLLPCAPEHAQHAAQSNSHARGGSEAQEKAGPAAPHLLLPLRAMSSVFRSRAKIAVAARVSGDHVHHMHIRRRARDHPAVRSQEGALHLQHCPLMPCPASLRGW